MNLAFLFNLVIRLTGLSFSGAALVVKYLEYASWISLLMAFTGIGFGAASIILAYRYAIQKVLWSKGKYEAIQL